MKKVLVSAIAVLMIAGAANATLIGLQWKDVATQSSAVTAPNTPVTAQFYMTNGGSDATPTISGIGLVINAWADPACTIPVANVFQVSSAPTIVGWGVAGANNNAQLNGLQFAAANGPNYATPAGKSVLMEIGLQYTGNPAPGTAYYLTIKRDLDPTATSSVIFDAGGADFMTNNLQWDSRYAATYNAGYWAFGNWGNKGWSRQVGKPPVEVGQTSPNPLILLTPEPASLALLALGGFAALRRR